MEPIRVLLVEDHRDTAVLLVRLLREDRYRVAVAGTVAEAKRLCDQQTFDVLVCDLELPDGDGVEVMHYARRHCKVAGVVFSGHATQEHRDAAHAAGFEHYLVKPATLQQVEEAIMRAAARKTAPRLDAPAH